MEIATLWCHLNSKCCYVGLAHLAADHVDGNVELGHSLEQVDNDTLSKSRLVAKIFSSSDFGMSEQHKGRRCTARTSPLVVFDKACEH